MSPELPKHPWMSEKEVKVQQILTKTLNSLDLPLAILLLAVALITTTQLVPVISVS